MSTNKLNVYTCSSFTGIYPVGVAAVVIAESPVAAAIYLQKQLKLDGLQQQINSEQMLLVESISGNVIVINNGDY